MAGSFGGDFNSWSQLKPWSQGPEFRPSRWLWGLLKKKNYKWFGPAATGCKQRKERDTVKSWAGGPLAWSAVILHGELRHSPVSKAKETEAVLRQNRMLRRLIYTDIFLESRLLPLWWLLCLLLLLFVVVVFIISRIEFCPLFSLNNVYKKIDLLTSFFFFCLLKVHYFSTFPHSKDITHYLRGI